jgi:hypothetical protein
MINRVRYCVTNAGHSRAAEYALRTLLEMIISPDCLVRGAVAGSREDEVIVVYGAVPENAESSVQVFESDFFGSRYGTVDVLPRRPVVRVENIPAPYRDGRGPSDTFCNVHATERGASVDCHVDVVAGSFFMLTRYEETVVRSVDVFDRFPAEASVAYQEGFLQEPIVNQYAEKLLEMLRTAGFTGERRTWWGTAPWAIALTHDIDQLHRFPHGRPPALAIARSLVGKAGAGTPRMANLLVDYVGTATHRKRDEYDCLEELAAWELSVGVHASYYFLGDSASGRFSADYGVGSTEVMAKMKTVARLGHEVGFHAGFWAYRDIERFHGELSRVRLAGLPIVGGRQHYLRWQTAATWRLWEAEDLSYDTTLGYSGAAGFRCGTCLPFNPYDIENDREMSISEWPLMFMDATYLSSWFEGTKVLDRMSQECQRYGGVLVLLWHNRNWSTVYAPLVREHFQQWLERSVTQGVVVDSIRSLARLANVTASH